MPLSPEKGKKLLLEILGDFPSNDRVLSRFKDKLTAEGFDVTIYEKENFGTAKFDVRTFRESYDLILYIGNVENAFNRVTNRLFWFTFWGNGNNVPWFVKERPTLFVSLGNPYHLVDVPMIKTYVNAYSNHDAMIDAVVLDFGNHFVGYLTLCLGAVGSHPDAPVKLGLSFAERPEELLEKAENYRGWISASWIQQEQIHVDVLPGTVSLPRRYAFRYVKIEVLAVSDRFRLTVENAVAETVTSADDAALTPYKTANMPDEKLEAIACRTLRNCMQTVFEDGPKRDRRLWLGDLRLQALANYRTYRNNDLVKACLYLFAALPLPNGRLPACVFLEPEPAPDDTEMFDYALLFAAALEDYVTETGDEEALKDLYPTAVKQLLLAEDDLGEDGIVKDSERLGWCFIDWKLDLNKQAAAQGVLLYALRSGFALAKKMGDERSAAHFTAVFARCADAANGILLDENEGLFVSGKNRQISAASQIWMLLGLSMDEKKARAVLRQLDARDLVPGITTPYLYHHYIEALLKYGEKEKALSVLRRYWGGMADSGADTFWELYDPKDPTASPYGGAVVNSYCHAWSCAPAYFLRTFFS